MSEISNFKIASETINFTQYGTSEELNELKLGYPTLRLNEFNSIFISHPSKYCSKLSGNDFEELQLKKGDVLICRTNGNPKLVGKSAIVCEDVEYAFASYLFRVRPNPSYINSETLVIFLNTKIGRLEIEKQSMVGNQANFSPAKFRLIKIPLLSKNLQNNISKLVSIAYERLNLSQTAYASAENLLLDALGLDAGTLADLKMPQQAVNANIKSFQGSFLASGRLDAEFYQTKYDRIVQLIEERSIEIVPFSVVIRGLANGVEIRDYVEDGGTRYLRVTDLSKDELNNNSPKFIEKQAPPERLRLNKNCLLISRSGSLGLVNIVNDDILDAVLSSHIFRVELNTDVVSPIFLETYFRSEIGQELLLQQNNGGVVPEINHEGLRRVPVPVLARDEMDAITEVLQDKRKEAKRLSDEAKNLLDLAKRAVEVAIEEDEEQAFALINSVLRSM